MTQPPISSAGGHSRNKSFLWLATGCICLAVAGLIGISDNPPGILALFLGFVAVILGLATLFGGNGGRSPAHQVLYWAPRALCMAYAFFISLFAMDVFGGGRGFRETAVALFMHLLPTFLIVGVLVLAWRREWIGGVLFLGLAVFSLAWTWDKPAGNWFALMLISGPLALTGVLFLLNWRFRSALRSSP
ncbi:MAG: hypothetical protein WB626_03010 [Bacteroidota bacterium]